MQVRHGYYICETTCDSVGLVLRVAIDQLDLLCWYEYDNTIMLLLCSYLCLFLLNHGAHTPPVECIYIGRNEQTYSLNCRNVVHCKGYLMDVEKDRPFVGSVKSACVKLLEELSCGRLGR